MLVARSHDLKMLENKLKNAKSTREREGVRRRMADLEREDKDPEIARLRHQLVRAARAGDNDAGDAISEQIYLHQAKIGKIQAK